MEPKNDGLEEEFLSPIGKFLVSMYLRNLNQQVPSGP